RIPVGEVPRPGGHRHRRPRHRRGRDRACRQLRHAARAGGLRAPHRTHGARRSERPRLELRLAGGARPPAWDREVRAAGRRARGRPAGARGIPERSPAARIGAERARRRSEASCAARPTSPGRRIAGARRNGARTREPRASAPRELEAATPPLAGWAYRAAPTILSFRAPDNSPPAIRKRMATAAASHGDLAGVLSWT